MEKRLNKKAEGYITTFKDSIREKVTQMGMTKDIQVNQLLQYIYDYDRLSFNLTDVVQKEPVMSNAQEGKKKGVNIVEHIKREPLMESLTRKMNRKIPHKK
jgi:antitoxin component of RelBE/YafQ-DinJ toxin-antitoxin module